MAKVCLSTRLWKAKKDEESNFNRRFLFFSKESLEYMETVVGHPILNPRIQIRVSESEVNEKRREGNDR